MIIVCVCVYSQFLSVTTSPGMFVHSIKVIVYPKMKILSWKSMETKTSVTDIQQNMLFYVFFGWTMPLKNSYE